MQLQPVRPGDIVDVIAPASRCTDQELRRGLAALKELGLEPRVPRNIFGRTSLFSNTDEERLKQLRAAVFARDSKMIWCVRGGYGASRLMSKIQRWPKPRNAKIFLGYSDITTLHAHFNQKWGWPTLHGPLLDRLGRGIMHAGERRELLGLIFGELRGIEFRGLRALNSAARRTRTLRGPILGGNLAVLQSGLGTPSSLKPDGCILFLEDTGERPHRVDRMLTQLSQVGWFNNTRAVVFGHFQLSEAKDQRELWNDVMKRFASDLKIPVLRGLPVGHDPKRQYALPLNTLAVLKTGRAPSLRVDSGIASA